MSKFEEVLDKAMAQFKELGLSHDHELLTKVAKGLGPALYNTDASLVSTSSKPEMETVMKNFIMGKLGVSDEAMAQKALDKVAETMKPLKRKMRVVFYYLLTVDLGKESVYA